MLNYIGMWSVHNNLNINNIKSVNSKFDSLYSINYYKEIMYNHLTVVSLVIEKRKIKV